MPIHKQRISILADGKDVTRCPTCGMAVRIIRRSGGCADHYEALENEREIDEFLAPIDEKTAAIYREQRKGKKTVAIVGLAATSCSLAPFNELDVEIWACNEMHAFSWLTRVTRWFQIHTPISYKRDIAKRGIRGHYEWLKKNSLDIPIYLQYYDPDVPKSVAYPLREVTRTCLKNFTRGADAKTLKYFTSSLAYMMGIALLEGRDPSKPDEKPFDRIEVYGFEMSDDIEFVKQKACAEFWIGLAMGMGTEVFTVEGNQLLLSMLYGGDEQGAGW